MATAVAGRRAGSTSPPEDGLAAVDDRYEDWARAVGVPVGSVSEEDKPDLLAELDAAIALLYELDESDVRHIFQTFHAGWDYHDRLGRVLVHFDRLGGEQPERHGLAAEEGPDYDA